MAVLAAAALGLLSCAPAEEAAGPARAADAGRGILLIGNKGEDTMSFVSLADGRLVYAAETGRNSIAEVDLETGTVLRRLPAGTAGDGLGIAP
jgi:hypothetical protein